MNQCWKFPRVRQSKADNFGGGPGTFCWFFFNFMFMICNSRHEDLQLFIPPLQRSWKRVYWYHLVRLPDCGQNRVRSVSSRILIGSISYSHILSSNFRRCVACNARFKIQNPIWLNGMGNHEAAGVSSERRRSSCSTLTEFQTLLWIERI